MSQDPNVILGLVRVTADAATTLGEMATVDPKHLKHLLAIIDHQDAQLAALRKLAPAAPTPNETVCQEADRLVSHDRQQQYGHPKEDFSRTAAMWEPIFGLPPGAISPDKVAMAMICVKLSRLCHGYKRDTAVDICGYAKTIDMIHAAP